MKGLTPKENLLITKWECLQQFFYCLSSNPNMQILKADITTELEENYAYTPSSSYFLWRARNYHSNILPELDRIWVLGPFVLNRVFDHTRLPAWELSVMVWTSPKDYEWPLSFLRNKNLGSVPARGANGEAARRKLVCVARLSDQVNARTFPQFPFFLSWSVK